MKTNEASDKSLQNSILMGIFFSCIRNLELHLEISEIKMCCSQHGVAGNSVNLCGL